MEKLLQRLAPHYQSLAKLGEGGMGMVYLVRHRHLDQVRVAKVMRSTLRQDPKLIQRFRREARVLSGFKHPNIARIYELFANEMGEAAIIMEWVPGEDLKQLGRRLGPVPLATGLEIGRQTLLALEHLHDRQFVHRDVSPDNIMLTWQPTEATQKDTGELGWVVKMIDLGIAKSITDTSGMTATGSFLGKVRYSSPERLSAEGSLDPRGDLYSFAVVMYELLTGHCPIQGHSPESLISGHLFQPPKTFDETDADGKLPQPVRRILLSLLKKKPEERPGSATELLQAWDQLVAENPVSNDRDEPWVKAIQAGFGKLRSLDPKDLTEGVTATVGSRPEPQPGTYGGTTLVAGEGDPEAGQTTLLTPSSTPNTAPVEPLSGRQVTDRGNDAHSTGNRSTPWWNDRKTLSALPALAAMITLVIGIWFIADARLTDSDLPLSSAPSSSPTDSTSDPDLTAQIPDRSENAHQPEALLGPEDSGESGNEPGSSPQPSQAGTDPSRPATDDENQPATTIEDFSDRPADPVTVDNSASESTTRVIPGTLILLATPWGELRSLRSPDGQLQTIPSPASTPLALKLLPGTYEAELVNDRLAQSRSVTVRVNAGSVSRHEVKFEQVDADALLRSMGW